MALSLKESRAIRDLANEFYGFLPGSGSAAWKGHVSFKSVAQKTGVGEFWQAGSKLPMITALLERTLEHRRGRFEALIIEIVRAGLTYREKSGFPIKPTEVEKINGLILEVGFKFPDLWDRDFLTSLKADGSVRASKRVNEERAAEMMATTKVAARQVELDAIKKDFLALHGIADRPKAGLELEKVLNRLFKHFGLDPREAFRVVGEQIDGSFELDHEVYLLEAKWHAEPRPAADLYVFREKIEGKSKFTHGLFLSMSGVSSDAQDAITRGKQPNFFIVNGHDVMMILEGNIDLPHFLRKRQRHLAEKGRVCVPFSECME